ncbi:sensor domain-containing diguanylate cyclase [Bacillus cihuensis]|uniref:sensor domain-containing diguanylate cyclase n=1 Tax=Bacillus cihuensis TaxID=1208599 RepID=UPI0003FADDFB|nr:sensor domain-containing diguanylate cyclase [Bacillus cihuensis]
MFDLIWNNTTDAIFTIDHNGAIIDANPAFVDLFGWSVKELKGLTFPPFFSHITKAEHQIFLKHLREGRTYPYVVSKRKHKDGKVLDVIASYRSINNQDVLAVGMSYEQVEKIVERMHTICIAPYQINGHTFNVTLSIGISVYPEHGSRGEVLISHADQALYRAKESRNRFVIYLQDK